MVLGRARSLQTPAFCLLVTVMAFVVYWPALSGGFIWDDTALVTGNTLVHAHDGVYRMWFTTEPIDYWPATNTTYWLEWRLWGINPVGYHVINVLQHAASACLLWVVLRRLAIPGAELAALLFVVHPVNVESVAWIAQRKDTQSLLFFLLALLWYLVADSGNDEETTPITRKAPFKPRAARRSRSFYWLSVAAFTLAMLSKGSVATFPLMVLWVVWWRRGDVTLRDARRALPFCAISAALTAVNIWFQTRHITQSLRDVSPVARLLGAGAVVWFYLSKALVPVKLMFVYPQWHIQSDRPQWWVPLAAVILTTAVLWRWRTLPGIRAVLFAWGLFCVALVPVMGLADAYFMRYSLVADHYQHIALLVVAAGVAAALVRGLALGATIDHQALSSRTLAGRVVSTALVVGLGTAAWTQSRLYADAETLWTATSRANPTCWLCETNLAVPLVERGTPADLSEAVSHLMSAARINPDAAEAHEGLGVALQRQGRLREAIAEHERALVLHPRFSAARENLVACQESLGLASSEAGQFQDAVTLFDQALRNAPAHAGTHRELGYALLRLGRTNESLMHLKEAVRLDPASPETHDTLATLWRTLNRPDQAIAEYREAVRLAPSAAEWHNNLGSALLDSHELAEAAQEFREALRSDPQSASAHRNLGVTLAAMNRLDEAATQLKEALRLEPGFSDAQLNLDEVTARIRRK
jgi:tetratricopeptide (TPR) repeat protein